MVQENTTGNPLAAGSLAVFMAASLPKGASPPLKNPWDAIALAVHAGMIAVGFRLIGLGEDHRIDTASDAQDPEPLPSEWNATSSYAFRYKHAQSSMEYLVKVSRLGSKAVVLAMAIGADKTTTFEVTVKDYVSESSIPSTAFPSDASTESISQTLQDVFISVGRLGDLGALLKISVIQKLAPGLNKDGYEEYTEAASASGNNQRRSPPPRQPQAPQYDPLRDDPLQPPPARPYPFNDPLAVPPRRGPLPDPIPGFEDEYEINRPARGYGVPGGRFPNLGDNDLYPQGLGPNDPLRPHFGGGLPRPGAGGGGMHPTFDDPMFGGRGGIGGGYDPMAPPGARYDPTGPGGAPRDGRGGMGGPRFPGGGGLGGRPPNPFGGYGDGDFI
ncbi:uncharacterized protein BDZ99DRAFT_406859 [Mytilinidion resinicola]|uniref:Uncharacterized protein n=1 Tax=Mytilinidion resinicola TaxID=574789 RepID=A0A6A6Z607_9PEZI|nr:uncharacterized protein BDZ99DRAFT_406859 [Mytilinidion resinicola]KAF2816248.1 hypothetical protein BDZ99DRAFT_406859 [Mytilinidion resinicola]